MYRIWNRLKEESAGAMVENVIILPLVFVLIYALIMTSFIMHDRATVDAAAQRGAIYASYCIIDPNYSAVTGQDGELDFPDETDVSAFSFKGVGKNIKAYRCFTGGSKVEDVVAKEVKAIIERTRIPWKPIESVSVQCEQQNMFLYQDITVTVTADYSIPKVFGLFGLDTEYEYQATATTCSTDADEFIRNADLAVDMLTALDEALGSPVEKAIHKLETLGVKIVEGLKDE